MYTYRNNTVKALLKAVAVGKTTTELSLLGNSIVTALCEGVFKADKKMKKGIAFPCSVSVNECAGNNAPLKVSQLRT
jgi:methionine aminopeptidase